MFEASGCGPTCKDLLPAVSFVPCIPLHLWPGGCKHMRTGPQLVIALSWLARGAHSWLGTDQAIDQSTDKATPLCWIFLYIFVITRSAKKFPVLGGLTLSCSHGSLLQAQLNLIPNFTPCFLKCILLSFVPIYVLVCRVFLSSEFSRPKVCVKHF